VALVAAAELVALLVIGGAWLAKPDPSAPAVRAKTTKAVASTPAPRAAQAKVATRAKVAPVDLPRRNVKVVVLNGNGRQGAAAAAASRVSRRGYRIGVVANAPSHDYPRSIVMYRSGFAAEGRRLARDLGVPIVSPLDGLRPGQLGGAHAVLILGT